MQDYLGLDNDTRTNKPSTLGINWRWRVGKKELSAALQKEILGVTKRYGRMNWFQTEEEKAEEAKAKELEAKKAKEAEKAEKAKAK